MATTTTLPTLPSGEIDVTEVNRLMTDRLWIATTTARQIHDDVDSEDPASSDLLHQVVLTLEKSAWMLASDNPNPHEEA